MSEPTVEEVREALDEFPWSLGDFDIVIHAAARLWVDANQPDIEAATGKYEQWIERHQIEWPHTASQSRNARCGGS